MPNNGETLDFFPPRWRLGAAPGLMDNEEDLKEYFGNDIVPAVQEIVKMQSPKNVFEVFKMFITSLGSSQDTDPLLAGDVLKLAEKIKDVLKSGIKDFRINREWVDDYLTMMVAFRVSRERPFFTRMSPRAGGIWIVNDFNANAANFTADTQESVASLKDSGLLARGYSVEIFTYNQARLALEQGKRPDLIILDAKPNGATPAFVREVNGEGGFAGVNAIPLVVRYGFQLTGVNKAWDDLIWLKKSNLVSGIVAGFNGRGAPLGTVRKGSLGIERTPISKIIQALSWGEGNEQSLITRDLRIIPDAFYAFPPSSTGDTWRGLPAEYREILYRVLQRTYLEQALSEAVSSSPLKFHDSEGYEGHSKEVWEDLSDQARVAIMNSMKNNGLDELFIHRNLEFKSINDAVRKDRDFNYRLDQISTRHRPGSKSFDMAKRFFNIDQDRDMTENEIVNFIINIILPRLTKFYESKGGEQRTRFLEDLWSVLRATVKPVKQDVVLEFAKGNYKPAQVFLNTFKLFALEGDNEVKGVVESLFDMTGTPGQWRREDRAIDRSHAPAWERPDSRSAV